MMGSLIDGRDLYRYPHPIRNLAAESGLSLDAVLTVIEHTPPDGRIALPQQWAMPLNKVLRRARPSRDPAVDAQHQRHADERRRRRGALAAKTGYMEDSFEVIALMENGGVLPDIAQQMLNAAGDWVLGSTIRAHLKGRCSHSGPLLMHSLDLGWLERRRGRHGVVYWRATAEFPAVYNGYLALMAGIKRDILTALKSRRLSAAGMVIAAQPHDRILIHRAIQSLLDEQRIKVYRRTHGGKRAIYCLYNSRNRPNDGTTYAQASG